MLSLKITTLTSAVFLFFSVYSQRAKDGNYTVTAANTVINTYTTVTANATIGSTSVTVANNALTGGVFSGALAQGDLVMIIQMQGASLNINTDPSDGDWGANYHYTYPLFFPGGNYFEYGHLFGEVLNLNNAGNFETREVLSVTGSNTITFTCGLQNAYTAAGHVQIVRIPRFDDLTVNSNMSIVPVAWNGSTGGIVAAEVNGDLTLNANSLIDASAMGFRGGAVAGTSNAGNTSPHGNGPGNGSTYMGSDLAAEGGRKGEGIGGYTTEYAALFSEYGRGAMANGGGGGGYQNAGGGGGANVGTGTHTGKGIPSPAYAAFWNLELAGFGASTSPGGGRGGYSLAEENMNEATLGPNQTAWGGDARKENGGMGGHALASAQNRMFMGGGGGAGGQDSGQGGSGGRGGGIVFLTVYGTVQGTGMVRANGQNGTNSNPLNQTPSFTQRRGNDGAGGAGAGGYIYIKNSNAIPATITLNAIGGEGGDQDLRLGSLLNSVTDSEAGGPGAGGAGGGIAFTSGTPVQSVAGGASGITLQNGGTNALVGNFPPNGATNGGNGSGSLASQIFDIIAANDTLCSNQSTTLTATVTGTQPASSTVTWYAVPFGGAPLATGLTYNTPVLGATTTYYIGLCPGTFRTPVTVVVGSSPSVTGTAVIQDATCSSSGGITGLSATGGTAPYTYDWNGSSSPSADLSNAAAGSYTLTVTDATGCTATSGPHTINGVAGPTIDATAVVVQDENCGNADGSITGITASGVATLSYSWSNGGGNTLDASALSAGMYTLTVTDGNGCISQSGPHTVSNIGAPVIDITGLSISDELCNGTLGSINGITASGSGTLSYSWSNGGGNTADASGLTAGTYTLTVTDNATACTATSGPHTVGFIDGPTIDETAAVVTDESCNGTLGSVTGITALGTGLSYAWDNGGGATADATGLSQGTYSLTVTDANGCTAVSSPHVVGYLDAPVIDITAISITDEGCNGALGSISGITASGIGNLSYSWDNSPLTAADITNLTAGNYTVTVTDDATGCTDVSGPHTVGTTSGPSIDASNVSVVDENCTSGDGSITGITAAGTGLSYAWDNGGGNALNATGLSAGNYTLTVTDGNGCAVQSGPYTVSDTPGPSIDDANMVVSDELCNGTQGSINGIVANGNNLSYQWTNGGGNTLDIGSLTAGTYSLTITDNVTGCTDQSGPYTVDFIAGPSIDDSGIAIVNENCNGNLGSISGITASGQGTLTYSWDNTTSTSISPLGLTQGMYTLTVTDDATGCTAQAGPFTVGYTGGPDAAFTYQPQNPVMNQDVFFTDASSGNVVIWSWQIDTMSSNSQNEAYIFPNEGFYTVTLTVFDQNGCSDAVSVTIDVLSDLSIPNVITPNNDGVNDFFELGGLLPNTRVIIVNRWGNLIFESSDYDNSWNGKDYAGNDVTEGVYTYVVTLPDGKQMHGFVHVVSEN